WPNAAQPDGQEYSLSLHADDLIGLIEALGLERVHLVASSYGAYVALLVTLRRPDLVRSLVLAEPPILPWLGRTPAGDSLLHTFDRTVFKAARAAFVRDDSVGAVQRFWDGLAGATSPFDALPEGARARLLRSVFELRLETRADPADYMPALACKDIGGIRSPVLLVTGERSPRMFHVINEELARCLAAEETAAGTGPKSQPLSPPFTTKSASSGAPPPASAGLQIGTGANSLTISQAQIVLAEIELSPNGSCSTTDEADDCDELEAAPALVDLPVDGTTKVALDGGVPPGTYSALQAQLDAVMPDEDEPGGSAFLPVEDDNHDGTDDHAGGTGDSRTR